MNIVKITEITTGINVFSSNFIRFSINEDRMSIMFDKSFIKELNSLSRNKVYKIIVMQDNSLIIDTMAMFISYNFAFMTSTTSEDLVIGDNTALFKVLQ